MKTITDRHHWDNRAAACSSALRSPSAMVKVSLVVNVLVIGLKIVKWSSNGVGTKDLLEHDFGVYQLLHRSR